MTPFIHIKSAVFQDISSLLANHLPCHSIYMVSDTHTAAAYQLQDFPYPIAHHHCFESSPNATIEQALTLTKQAYSYGGMIAVGSGTINDVVKYAAHQLGIPYVVLASAPSMNGYISTNASLRKDGYKQSFPATPPTALYADMDVLRTSPSRLIASGVGDTLCRSTVAMDMHYAQLLTGEEYPTVIMQRMCDKEQRLLATMRESIAKQPSVAFIGALMECLIEAGQAMNIMGSSAPASQSEHMLVHLLEMLAPQISSHYFHGECVAMATLIARVAQEKIDGIPLSKPPLSPFPFTEIATHYGEKMAHTWQQDYAQKQARYTSSPLPKAEKYSADIALSSKELRHYLTISGCQVDHEAMNISSTLMQHALHYVAFSRGRFTVWDRL